MHSLALRLIREIAPLFFPQTGRETQFFPATMGIDQNQAQFFRRNGYLVKRNVLAPEMVARTVDYIWSLLPSRLRREDPATWVGPVADSLSERDVRVRLGRLKFRESVRQEAWLYDMIGRNPCIRATVEAILGSSRTADLPYVRGIYPVFPCKRGPFKRPRPHADHHRFLVGTLTYLSDVAPGGGGFHVWPGSHLTMRRCFERYAGARRTNRYHRELYLFALRNPALEVVAPAGSTIFWHHRLVHAAGINRTSRIRHAILADFLSTDFNELAAMPVGSDEWKHWEFTLDDHPGPRSLRPASAPAYSPDDSH